MKGKLGISSGWTEGAGVRGRRTYSLAAITAWSTLPASQTLDYAAGWPDLRPSDLRQRRSRTRVELLIGRPEHSRCSRLGRACAPGRVDVDMPMLRRWVQLEYFCHPV